MIYRTIVLSTLLASVAAQTSCDTSYCSPTALDDCGLTDVDAATDDVYDDCDDASYDWTDINDDGYQGDKKFMDGNGPLNDGLESDIATAQIAGSVIRFQENVVTKARLNWPEYEELLPYVDREEADYGRPYMSNFNMTNGSCELSAAMCCFTATRDGSTLADNAEVCSHDLGDSAPSTHVANGIGFFDDGNDATYCVATTWSDDESDITNVYKGNLIFDISYGTFLDKKYVKGIHGAPMCGCIEQMPTIKPTTQVACRTVSAGSNAPEFKFTKDGSDAEVEMVPGDLVFEDCQDDFVTHYGTVHSGTDKPTKLEKHILPSSESCGDAADAMLNEKAWIPGSDPELSYTVDESLWHHITGTGIRYVYLKNYDLDKRDEDFRALIDASSTKIIRRYCDTCRDTHKDIYYRRLTAIPDDVNFLDLFLNNWSSENNELGVDFTLHSTYDDAVNLTGNWTYCNYNDGGVGFPRDCGPTRKIDCQWNSHTRRMCSNNAYNPYVHGFYVDKN